MTDIPPMGADVDNGMAFNVKAKKEAAMRAADEQAARARNRALPSPMPSNTNQPPENQPPPPAPRVGLGQRIKRVVISQPQRFKAAAVGTAQDVATNAGHIREAPLHAMKVVATGAAHGAYNIGRRATATNQTTQEMGPLTKAGFFALGGKRTTRTELSNSYQRDTDVVSSKNLQKALDNGWENQVLIGPDQWLVSRLNYQKSRPVRKTIVTTTDPNLGRFSRQTVQTTEVYTDQPNGIKSASYSNKPYQFKKGGITNPASVASVAVREGGIPLYRPRPVSRTQLRRQRQAQMRQRYPNRPSNKMAPESYVFPAGRGMVRMGNAPVKFIDTTDALATRRLGWEFATGRWGLQKPIASMGPIFNLHGLSSLSPQTRTNVFGTGRPRITPQPQQMGMRPPSPSARNVQVVPSASSKQMKVKVINLDTGRKKTQVIRSDGIPQAQPIATQSSVMPRRRRDVFDMFVGRY